MLSLSSLSVKTVAVIYDRVSTKGQILSFDTHLPILRSAVAKSGISFDEIHEMTEIGSAFNHYESLRLYSILDQKNIHVFIYDTSRLCRDLEAAGAIIKKIQANKIKFHQLQPIFDEFQQIQSTHINSIEFHHIPSKRIWDFAKQIKFNQIQSK